MDLSPIGRRRWHGYVAIVGGRIQLRVAKNGFTIIDVTRDNMTFTHFMWRPPQAVAEIDTMPPARIYEVPRRV